MCVKVCLYAISFSYDFHLDVCDSLTSVYKNTAAKCLRMREFVLFLALPLLCRQPVMRRRLKLRLHTAINRADFVSWCML